MSIEEEYKKGKKMYVPAPVILELNQIKQKDNLITHADAFKELAKYSRVGRETDIMMRKFVFADIWDKKRKR